MFKKLLSLSVLICALLWSVSKADAQSVSILSPIANTTVSGGVPFAIVWTSTGVSAVRFEYSLDGGQHWKWDNSYISSSPYTTAQVPYYASNPNILIRLVDYYNLSNGTTISGIRATGMGSPKITVTNPSSISVPTSYTSGSSVYISWNNSSIQQSIPFVNVLLSTNSGIDFPITVLAFTSSSSGALSQIINFPQGTDNAVIRVEDSYNPGNFGLSNSFKILPASAAAGTVAITSPSDNTTISGCNQTQIYYTGNISDYVNFEYSTNGGTSWTTANTFLWANTSSNFAFSVPSYTGNMLTRLTRYGAPYTTFTGPSLSVISSVPVLRFSSPTISAITERATNLNVSWNATAACIPQILLQSSVNNGSSWVNLYQGTNNQAYSLPTTILSGLPTVSLLKISDVSNPSNANTIQLVLETAPTLSVSSVVGISINCPNVSANLKFSKKGMTAIYNFSLQYSTDGGTSWQSISPSFYAYSSPDNTYNWSNVPSSVLGLSNVLVKVTELGTGTSVSGVGSIDFTTQLPAPSLGISSPVAQQPTCNTYFKYYGNVCGNVDVYLTTNSGASLIPVTVNANFLNSYMYLAFPTSYDNGQNYRVIYRSSTNPTASIMGNNFTFTNGFGSVYLSSPLTGGTTGTISLASPQVCRNTLVNIDLSTNNGVNFYNLTTNGLNDGSSFSFAIPNISTTGFRVKVTSVSDPTVSILGVASTIDYTPAQKVISITSVNLSTLCGSSSSFTWQKNYSGSGYYKIEYSRDGGQYWESIADNSYISNVTNTTYVVLPNFTTTQLLFRVRDNADPATVGYSSLLSFAPPKPVITMGVPSNVQAGSGSNTVYFTPSCVPLVDIFVSTNNGVDFNPLYTRLSSAYSYFQWQAYNFPVAQAKYKIVSSVDANVSVTSAAFSITGAAAVAGITFTGVPAGISNCSSPTFGFRHVDYAFNSFNIDLSTDNGASWKRVLFLSTYGGPVYPVTGLTIGNLPVNTVLYYRISRSDIPSIVATTSGITITSAGVAGLAFTSPLANSYIASNSLYSITLNSTTAGCILNNIKLEYSLDNGSSFKLINDDYSLATTPYQSISWYVPSGTNTTTALLRASDVNANSVTVTSAAFTIVDPNAVVTVPSVIYQGQNISIPINYVGISPNYYYGFYSVNGGNTWTYTSSYAYLIGSGSATISFTPPIVGSLTGALFAIGNSSSYASSTIKYTSNAFSIDRPLLTTTSPIAGQTVATGSGATANVAFTYQGWNGTTQMTPYYSFDNGITANLMTGANTYYVLTSGNQSFTWSNLPAVTSLTSAIIVWGNATNWSFATTKYYGDPFYLAPTTNNQITVTGLSDANPCQGKIIAVSFTGFGTFTGSNIFKAEIGFGSTPGSGLLVGQLVSTLSSGIVLATIPSGYSGSYNIRVYSSSPYISLSARLISKPLTISSQACITANNNSALSGIGGVGSVAYGGTIAFQTNTTFNAGNQFIAQISDVNGSFNGSPTNIGTVTGTTAAAVGNLINVSLPTSLQTSSNYRVRVVSTNPVSIGADNGFAFVLNNALIQVFTVYGTNFCPGSTIPTEFDADGNFNSNNQFLVELSYTNGVFYNNTIGGYGDNIGGVALTVSGIVPQGITASNFYRTRVSATNPFSQTAAGYESNYFTIQNSCFASINYSSAPFLAGQPFKTVVAPYRPFNNGNAYIIELSDAAGSFSNNPVMIGSISGINNVTVNGVIPANTPLGSSYYFRVRSTNHGFTGAGIYLGTINPVGIAIGNTTNNAYCPGALVQMQPMTVVGYLQPGNSYTVQLSDYYGGWSSPVDVLSFNSTATGIVPIPAFNMPTSVVGAYYGYRYLRVLSSSPVATSVNTTNAFYYYDNCYNSISPSASIMGGGKSYTVNYGLSSQIGYQAGNQFIAEFSATTNFTTATTVGIATSTTAGVVNITIPSNFASGTYYLRVRSTNFASNSFYSTISINQVGIDVPMNIDNAKVYCSTGKLIMPAFTVTSSVNGDNTYLVQLSNGAGFSNPYNVLTLTSANAGVITVPAISLPNNLSNGNYYIRVISTSPYSVSGNYSNAIYIYNQCITQPYAGSSLCPGDYGSVGVTAASFNAGNTFSLLLSDDLGNFNSPIVLSVITSTGYPASVNIPFTVPGIIANGSNYRVKVVSSDFAFESATSAGISIKQTCIAAPGGYNAAVSQCSFLPIITVAAVGTVNPANDYKLVLLNSAGFPVVTNTASGLTSILGVVSAGTTGVIAFSNIILPTVSGTYYLRVDATDPNVTGNGITQLNIANNCIGTPYIPNAKYCAGDNIVIPIYISAGSILNVGNKFVVELSDGSGSFASPTTVLSRLTTTANFYDNITIPSGIASGTSYRIRIKSTNLVNTSGLSNTFAIDQVCLNIPTLAYGPYIGGSSSISIPVVNTGAINGGNNYSASLYDSYGSLIGSIGTPTSANTITGTLPAVTYGGYYYVKVTSSSPVATSYNSNYIIVNPTDIKVAPIASSYCVGSTISGITFTVAGSVNPGNQYALDLSDANGYFYYSYNNLASFADNSVGNKTIDAVLPIGISQSANYKLRIRSTNGSISNEVPININATFQWTGANGTDWNNTNNWSCPLIPTATIDVVIPTVTNYPVINITNAVARNITIDAGANATIASGALLSIYGDLIVNGTLSSSSLGGVYFIGAYSANHQILGTGDITLGLLTVPSYNYLSIRHNVNILNNFYNYGYAYNYSTLGVSGTLYNYNRFDAYNTVNVVTRFYNDYIFNYYNTYVSNPYFYIGGIFENNSQYFNPGYSNFVFNGNGNQYISGTYNTSFYNIQINNFSNLVLNRSINVYAGYANAGYFNGLGYDVRFVTAPNNVPTYITSSGYTNFGNVYFENINNVFVNSNIGVQGDFVNIAGFVSGNATLVSFTGSGLQNISATGIYNLTFNGIEVSNTNSELNVDAGLTVKGSFRNRGRFKNNRITVFESNQPQIISGLGNTVFTDFINNNTDVVTGVSVTSDVEIQGHFINNGLFNSSGYTITTSGLDMQTIAGTDIATFGSIENTNTVGVEVQQDVVVQGSFRNRGRFRSAANVVEFSGTTAQTVVSESTTIFNEVVNTNTTAIVSLQGDFTVNGDITNNGSLDATASVITTSGLSIQTISGTEAITLGTVINTNTLGVEATQDVVVMGSFKNRGRFRSATNSVSFDGSTTQLVSGDGQLQLNDVVNNNVTNLQITNTIELTGNIANNGSLDASTSVISTSGISVQSISGTDISFGTIINTNTVGGVSISAPIEITGNLVNNGSLESSSMVSFTGTNQTVSGTVAPLVNDVTITNSADVVVSGSFRTRGRVVNNSASVGLVASPSSTVSFEGTTTQSVEGTTPTVFGQVSMTNAAGLDVKQNISTTGISLSGGNLTVDNLKAISVTSPEPNALVRTNDSYVSGTLSRVVTATGAAYEFPVGTAEAYRGVAITFAGVNNAGSIAVTPSNTAPVVTQPAANGAPLALFDPTLGDTLKSILPVSWKVEAKNATIAGTYDIDLQAPLTLPGYTDPNALRVVKRTDDTSPWILAGTPTPVKTVTSTVVRAGRRNVSSFSTFAVAGTCSNVSRISSKPSIDIIGDEFKSNLEGNNYIWYIDTVAQRALTARQIKPLKDGKYQVRVVLSGCTSDASDVLSFAGANTKVQPEIAKTDFKLYPNPAKDEFTIESLNASGGVYLVELFDVIGKQVFSKTVTQTDGHVFRLAYNTTSLPTGIYYVKISANGKGKVLKLVIE